MKVEKNIVYKKETNKYYFMKYGGGRINRKAIFKYGHNDLTKVKFIKKYFEENGIEKTKDFLINNKEFECLNIHNISGEIGVIYDKQANNWKYVYSYKLKEETKTRQTIVGRFNTKEDAIKCKNLVSQYGVAYVREHKKELFPPKPKQAKPHYKTIKTIDLGKYKIIIKELEEA